MGSLQWCALRFNYEALLSPHLGLHGVIVFVNSLVYFRPELLDTTLYFTCWTLQVLLCYYVYSFPCISPSTNCEPLGGRSDHILFMSIHSVYLRAWHIVGQGIGIATWLLALSGQHRVVKSVWMPLGGQFVGVSIFLFVASHTYISPAWPLVGISVCGPCCSYSKYSYVRECVNECASNCTENYYSKILVLKIPLVSSQTYHSKGRKI